MNGAFALVEEWKAFVRKRHERAALDFLEELADLFAGRAVDPFVRDVRLPVEEVAVFVFERLEAAPLQAVRLHVIHAALDLALVSRHVGFRGEYHAAVVPREHFDLRVEFGVEPVGLRDGGLEIVDHDRLRDAAEVPERVFKSAEEVVGRLPPDTFTVCLARATQDDAQDVRAAALSPRALDRRALAEVDLHFLTRRRFDPPERQCALLAKSAAVALHRLVARGEAAFGDKILPDTLGCQAYVKFCENSFAKRLARARRPPPFGRRSRRRVKFGLYWPIRPGGRVGGPV